MSGDNHLEWRADYVSPGRRAMLQNFGSQDASAELRITLRANQEAKVKVNNRVIARTLGFQNAAAMAEIYSRDRELLLTAAEAATDIQPHERIFYDVQPRDDGYAVRSSARILDLAYLLEDCPIERTAATLEDAIEAAQAGVGGAVVPAFLDQREIYEALPQQHWVSMAIAIWTAHWQLDFNDVLKDPEALMMASPSAELQSAYYTIYRVTCGNYLAEIKSPDRAERIGEFPSTAAARAHCAIHNAACHVGKWPELVPAGGGEDARILGGAYSVRRSDDGKSVLSQGKSDLPLGRFDNTLQAEAYALVHRQAMSHFRCGAALSR